MADQELATEVDCVHLLLDAEKEQDVNVALSHCTAVAETLRPYTENLSRKKNTPISKGTRKKVIGSSDYALKTSGLNLRHDSIEYDLVKSFSIGELTDHITNPPGRTCPEAKFGKAFAIYGQEFACSVFKMIKGTSVPSLESLARWSIIGLFEIYCHNIIASGKNPKFDECPDPVLYCPIHDSNEMRFDDGSVYPVTTALSNAIRKFMQDLDLSHQLQFTSILSYPDGYLLPVCFHTDLFLKQKMLSVASYNGNWLDSNYIASISKQHHGWCGDLVLLYATACLKRAHCYFIMNQYSQCTEESNTVLKVPVELPNSIRARANLLRARSLYRAGEMAKEASLLKIKKSDCWRAQLQYLQLFRTAAQSFAYALELMNESEFNSEMHDCNIEMVLCLHEVFTAHRSDCQLKTCCLCWKNSHLCGSHIFPRFILEVLSSEAGILVGSELKGPKQVHYQMLCDECEQRFCNWGETYFKNLFFERVREQPSAKLEIPHSYWLYYFFSSLIWRLYFQFKYKASSFSEMLKNLPIFAMRKFLLSGDIQHLTTDCFLYLFIDKDVFDEVLCNLSHYKSYARRGGGCSFDPDESVFICYFLNYYLAFPIGTIQNSFLMQGSLKRLKFGEGVFEIDVDSQRNMPVFLERFICKLVAGEYDKALSGLAHQTHSRISRSLPEQSDETRSDTYAFLKVIRCLPNDVSVTLNPLFKYGIQLQGGFKVKYPPTDCKLAEEADKRYTLYLCEGEKGDLLALYRVYSPTCDHIYAFQFSVTSDDEIGYFAPCKNIRNKQYFEMLLNSDPALPEFLKTLASVMVFSKPPPMEFHFFLEGAEKLCLLQPDEDLSLPLPFTAIGKPVKFKNMHLWVCACENYDAVAILRLFSEIAYDEMMLYDYLVALQFHSENGNVKFLTPLHSPHEESETDKEIMMILLEFQPILTASTELLLDPSFQSLGVVHCLPSNMFVDFLPINRAVSTENLVILNNLGTVSDPVFEFHSWLCSYFAVAMQKTFLVVLEKWKIANLPFVVVFSLQPMESEALHISSLNTLPGVPFTSIFMKMVSDYCSNDFNAITRNVVLSIQAALKINSRVRSIFTTGYDPLIKRKAKYFEESFMVEESSVVEEVVLTLDPVFCLPYDCKLVKDGEIETLDLSTDYDLLCAPLKTPLYTVWLCTYKGIHELIIVKTASGIESLCSSVVVTLNFVAAQVQSTNSESQFRFYPFSHLNVDEIGFVEENFLESETFQSMDPQFHVLMACIQIVLSQLYQSHHLQIYLPSEFQVTILPYGELQLLYPHPFIAGPLHQETLAVFITCWLCGEGLGMVKIENKATKSLYVTALSFEYSGTNVSGLKLVELPSGLQFLVQNCLYLEQNSSHLINSMFKDLCNLFTMGKVK